MSRTAILPRDCAVATLREVNRPRDCVVATLREVNRSGDCAVATLREVNLPRDCDPATLREVNLPRDCAVATLREVNHPRGCAPTLSQTMERSDHNTREASGALRGIPAEGVAEDRLFRNEMKEPAGCSEGETSPLKGGCYAE